MKPQHVHFIGIGGAGLSAIATVLIQQGYVVSGSDQESSANTQRLSELGATVYLGHAPKNLGRAELVVISSAIPADNAEIRAARRRGIPVLKRADWLGQMMAGQTGIAIAGTHGKTTTTAMTAFLLREGGFDPTYIIGGYVPQLRTNAAAGQSDIFVIEADEYDYTFLGLAPTVAVLTSVEWDHPDCFATPEATLEAFRRFSAQILPGGLLIGCGDSAGVRAVMKPGVPAVTYGLKANNDWRAAPVRTNRQGGSDFVLRHGDDDQLDVSLAIPGQHNVLNSMGAMLAAHQAGLPLARAGEIIRAFRGVARRFEYKGELNGITFVDDYAHHPTEIRATLSGARSRFGRRPLRVVFQPHTFSRTRALLAEFAASFEQADQVILLDIFSARETGDGTVSSAHLLARMRHPDAIYLGSPEKAISYLSRSLTAGDVLMTMGAGDVYQVGDRLLRDLD
jgi:UDP-N-acetylmuramate--alanine ligase